MTYAATLPAILIELGVSTLFIGILMGSMRLNGFLVNSFFGHIGDKYNPRKVLILCEFGAALGSILILTSWKVWDTTWLVPFFVANNIRVFFTALQAGSVQKLGKNFDNHLNLGGRFAVRINGATNGALFVGGITALILFKYITVENLVLFDAATFFLNGLIILFSQKSDDHKGVGTSRKALSMNVFGYVKALPYLAVMDLLLSLALCGSNTLNIRLLEDSAHLVPLMPTIFGGVAFLCSSFSLDRKFHAFSKSIWWVLAISLITQGLVTSSPELVLGIAVIRNLAYWIIYNSISREVMKSAPTEHFSAISSGRIALSISVLAIGEFWVGASKSISIAIEMLWRGVVAMVASFVPHIRKIT